MAILSHIDLKKTIDKKIYKDTLDVLEEKMKRLQLAVRDAGVPVVIAFEGWGASGKGTLIARAVYPLDPRYFTVCTMDKVTEEMRMRPFLWPFWNRLPAKGRVVFFDKSWHRLNLPGVKEQWGLNGHDEKKYHEDVNAFERQLTKDGTLIIKFFLHISREEQHRRFKELEKNPDTAWRVRSNDWEQNKEYDKYVKHYEKMLESTGGNGSPWNIIEADDTKYAAVRVFNILIQKIEERLARKPGATPKQNDKNNDVTPFIQNENENKNNDVTPFIQNENENENNNVAPFIQNINANKDIDESKYKKELSHYQQRISELGYKLYTKRRSVVIVYEGWDAAGKGGNIKRLTEELDPRSYEVVPISVPTAEEKSYHYLWRFYKRLPKDGHIAIFDRSWYGRVLVERVEGFARPEEWARAYGEINEMESHLFNHGTVILKFWLHIDPDEQLNRFHDRQADPLKQYKITYDDWRNRDKWKAYEQAVNEMIARTSTDYAPWKIIEANSKKFARVKVLKTVTDALEGALN